MKIKKTPLKPKTLNAQYELEAIEHESDKCSESIALAQLMKSEDWITYEVTKDLAGAFNAEACLSEIDEQESLAREDALMLDELFFELPQECLPVAYID